MEKGTHVARAAATVVFAALTAVLSIAEARATVVEATFINADARCFTAVTHRERGALGLEAPIVVPSLPVVGPLFDTSNTTMAGPECPSQSSTQTEQASSVAAAAGSGRWSLDLSVNTTRGAAAAHATVSLGASLDNPIAGDLFVRLDDVTQQFETSCTGCDGDPRGGYLVVITVHSASGDATVVCGSAPSGQAETAFTLPDDRCATDEDGGPARLPVSEGAVTIEFDVVADAYVQGAPGRAVDGYSVATVAARLAAFDVVPA